MTRTTVSGGQSYTGTSASDVFVVVNAADLTGTTINAVAGSTLEFDNTAPLTINFDGTYSGISGLSNFWLTSTQGTSVTISSATFFSNNALNIGGLSGITGIRFNLSSNDTVDASLVLPNADFADFSLSGNDDSISTPTHQTPSLGGAVSNIFLAGSDIATDTIVGSRGGFLNLSGAFTYITGIGALQGISLVSSFFINANSTGSDSLTVTDSYATSAGGHVNSFADLDSGTQPITIDGSQLSSSNTLSTQIFPITNTPASITILGGAGNDFFTLPAASLTSSDVVDGGGGTANQVDLVGSFVLTTGLGSLAGVRNVERFLLQDIALSGYGIGPQSLIVTDQYVASLAGPVQPTVQEAPSTPAVTVDGSDLTSAHPIKILSSGLGGGTELLLGGQGNDSLQSSDGGATLTGGAGNDTLFSGGGADLITGGSGNDQFKFAPHDTNGVAAAPIGNSTLTDFGAGDSILLASAVISAVTTTLNIPVTATVVAGDGTSTAQGNIELGATNNGVTPLYFGFDATPGADWRIDLDGAFTAANFSVGGSTNAVKISYVAGVTPGVAVFGTASSDMFTGGAGDDTLYASPIDLGAGDSLDGAGGTNILVLYGQGSFDLNAPTTLVNFGEVLVAGSGPESIHLRAGMSAIVADWNAGDTLVGDSGSSTIFGQGGGESLQAGSAGDWIMATGGANTLHGGAGPDTLFGGSGADSITAGSGNAFLLGNQGAQTGNDTLIGGSGHDTLFGGNGSDSIVAGTGNSMLVGGMPGQTGSPTLQGGGGNDTLFAAPGTSSLNGGAGNDLLIGGAAGDTLAGGGGTDTLFGQGGNNVFVVAASGDHDLIADFTSGHDQIDLTAFHFASFAALQSAAVLTRFDNAIGLALSGGTSLTIVGETSLAVGDFLL